MRVPKGEPDKGGGYIHRFNDNLEWKPAPPKATPTIDYAKWQHQQKEYVSQRSTAEVSKFAKSLGVSQLSLMQLGVGSRKVNGFKQWTFPMRDAEGRVIGIRTRDRFGKKCVTGSKLGLFMGASTPTGKKLLVVEGESDCAAAMSIGLKYVVGLPGAGQAGEHLTGFINAHQPTLVILFADNDGPGLEGMTRLQNRIPAKTRIKTPVGASDLREWVNAGASAADVAG